MTGKKRLISLIATMTIISLAVIGTSLSLLYNSAFDQQRARLVDTVKSQASLIIAVARYDQKATTQIIIENPEYDAFEATLSQLREAHENYGGLGETGEFTLAKLDGDKITFLLNRRHHDFNDPKPVLISSKFAQPMRRALRGKSGTIVGFDYRGEQVLAAYEPVPELGLGIVAKIDLSEIRAPFIQAGLISGSITIVLILLGAMLFFRIGNPMVRDLLEKETQLRDITNTIPGCIYQFILHKDGYISIPYISDTIEDFTGIKANIIIENATKLYDFIHPDDHASFKESIVQSAETMALWNHEFRVITSENYTMWLNGKSNPQLLPDGSVLWNGVLNDITERKQVEEALQTSEERFRTQMVQSPMVMEIYDLDGLQIEVNRAYEELWGFPASTTVNKFNVLKSNEVEDTGLMEYVKKAYAGEAVIIPEYVFNPTGETESGGLGRIRWLSTKIYPLKDSSGKVTNIVITHEDITGRKKAEEDLIKSEQNFNAFTNQSTEGIGVSDLDGNYTFVNPAFCNMVGWTAEELLQMTVFDVTADHQDTTTFKRTKTDEEGVPVTVMLVRKNGTEFLAEVTGKILSVNGKKSVLGTVRDITKSKEAEEALRESEKKFKRITERIYDVIVVANLDGKINYVSPSIIQVFGFQPEYLIGKSILEFIPKSEKHHAIEILKLCAAGKDVEGHHSEFLKKDGSYAVIELNAVPIIEDNEIVGVQAIIRDITETKRLQELESRASRLETAGTIAGQVAHDFNNLLAPLMAYPDFIRDELPHDNKAHAYLDDIENAAQKIAEINQDLLTMGRRGHYNQEVINLNRIVLHASKNLESQTGTITCELNLSKDLMNIKGGEAQIHRMLTNLMVNARDAMENVGQITIKTENFYANDTAISFGRVPKGEYVKLTLSDNGCGIPDDIAQKIFDPFFSTKTTDKKRGSGLGLSVVDAVINDHNGYIDMSSVVGEGTSFYIYFPITRESTNGQDIGKTCGGSETILVVDDDTIQLEVSTQILTKLGYRISSVESGEKAIEFLRANPQDLLILDMVMPGGIDGAETYRRILEFSPHQKSIILSGFSESDRVLEAQKLGAGAFVKKPISRNIIAAAVRRELDRKREIADNK